MDSETSSIREFLWTHYGPIMDAKALCKILHYPSVTALNTARSRGSLPFSPIKIERRRGVFALTKEIAEVLERVEQERTLPAMRERRHPEDATT